MSSTSSQFLSADRAGQSVESLVLAHGATRSGIYWLILLGIAGALCALPFINLDIAIRASGWVRSTSGRYELRSPVSGLIDQFLVRDNQQVAAGQPLFVLRSSDLAEHLARNVAQQHEHTDAIHDLGLLVASFSSQPTNATDLPRENAPVFKTTAFQQEYRQLLAQIDASHLGESRARSDLERVAALAAHGIASQQELADARYQVAQTHAAGELLVQQTLSHWQSQLRQEIADQADLASTEKQLLDERTHYTICAPVAGAVLESAVLGLGNFVVAGQPLCWLSPDDRLVVEIFVPSRDAGSVRAGQRVKVQVDAFPYTQWGSLGGVVEGISADAIAEGGAAMFKATVRLDATALRLPNGTRGELKKGLTVRARLLVTRRSLLQILYDGTGNWFDPANTAGTALPSTRAG